MAAEPIKAGPWGGPGGRHWSYRWPRSRLTKVAIAHGWAIDSIKFQTLDADGQKRSSQRFGGAGGSTTDTIDLSAGEYLTSIRGRYGQFSNCTCILSLTIVSNLDTYGPYGRAGPEGVTKGTYFDLPISNGVVVGFHGRTGVGDGFVDAIGVYLEQVRSPYLPVEAAPRITRIKETVDADAAAADAELFMKFMKYSSE